MDKGRVERLFGTLQDRLVKELRLQKISTMAQANHFLWDQFLPTYNARFAVEPRNATDAHRPLLKTQSLDAIFSLRSQRTLMNDFTLRFQNRYLQLSAEQPMRLSPKDKIVVETRLDGTTHLCLKGRYLNFRELDRSVEKPRPRSEVRIKPIPMVEKGSKRYKPAATHPWRRPLLLNAKTLARQAVASG